MQTVTTIGLDIAKSVFQVHGIDANGNVLIRRRLKRRYVLAFFQKLPPCLVGVEACATSHHWSRELNALGHTVRLMPPAYVKPYVKRQKNDAADAEATCEAVTRANMRFVETKTPEQQSCLLLHRTRQLFIRQQTSVINAIRAHMAEFGIVAPVGRKGVEQLLAVVTEAEDQRVPESRDAFLGQGLARAIGGRMARTRSGAAITTPRRRRVTPKEYRAAFAARVRQARTAARYPIDEMALLLGVTRDTYTKYEGRGASLMPHNLIVPFCLACRVSVEWLLTGIGPTRPR